MEARKSSENRDEQSEDSLVALYMDLTGASEKLARGVYAHLGITGNETPSLNQSWLGSVAAPAGTPVVARNTDQPLASKSAVPGTFGIFEARATAAR